jgi:hypothetical protein
MSSQLKESVEQDSDDVKVEIIAVNGTTSLGDIDWYFCKLTSVHSEGREHFKKFNPLKHLGMKQTVACNLCFVLEPWHCSLHRWVYIRSQSALYDNH